MNFIFILLISFFSVSETFKDDALFKERFTLRCFSEAPLHDGANTKELEKFRERIKKETEDELILYYEALKNISISEEEINKKILGLKIRYLSNSIDEIALKNRKSKKELLMDLKIELYIKKYLSNILFKDIKVLNKEIEDYYDQHSDDFIEKKSILLYQVFSTSKYDVKEAYKKLEEKEDFISVAKKYSKKEILLGWVSKKNLPKYFSEAFKLKKNKHSDIVKSDFGYHIFWVKDKKDAKYIELEKVSKKIKFIILAQKHEKKLQEFLKLKRKNL